MPGVADTPLGVAQWWGLDTAGMQYSIRSSGGRACVRPATRVATRPPLAFRLSSRAHRQNLRQPVARRGTSRGAGTPQSSSAPTRNMGLPAAPLAPGPTSSTFRPAPLSTAGSAPAPAAPPTKGFQEVPLWLRGPGRCLFWGVQQRPVSAHAYWHTVISTTLVTTSVYFFTLMLVFISSWIHISHISLVSSRYLDWWTNMNKVIIKSSRYSSQRVQVWSCILFLLDITSSHMTSYQFIYFFMLLLLSLLSD